MSKLAFNCLNERCSSDIDILIPKKYINNIEKLLLKHVFIQTEIRMEIE
mgnify:CR=1 FL=1